MRVSKNKMKKKSKIKKHSHNVLTGWLAAHAAVYTKHQTPYSSVEREYKSKRQPKETLTHIFTVTFVQYLYDS